LFLRFVEPSFFYRLQQRRAFFGVQLGCVGYAVQVSLRD